MVTVLPAIYCIRHSESGKCYVGSSISYKRRWYLHRSDLRHNRHHSLLLQRAWNKYGPDAFVWDVLEVVDATKEALEAREQHWIEVLEPAYNRSRSVNRHLLGRTMGPLSEERREKIRLANTGKKHSAETKSAISRWQKGRTLQLTEAQRSIRVASGRANIHYAQTPEAVAKMAQSKRGSVMSDATKDKKSRALKGRPWSAARQEAEKRRKDLIANGATWSDR